MRHGRLPWYEPAKLDGARQRLYEEITGGPRAKDALTAPLVDAGGRLEGPFNAMLVHPAVGGVLQQMGRAIRYESVLRPRSRELATLVVAAGAESDYEWHVHAALAARAGLSESVLEAIASAAPVPDLDDREAMVVRVARALVGRGDLDDRLYEEASSLLGAEELFDIVVLVGHYELVARLLRVYRTPLPEGARPRFSPAVG